MLCTGPPGRIHEQLDGPRELVVAADLAENTFREGLDTISRRVEQFRPEIAEAALNDIHEELIIGRPFGRPLQLATARLMDVARKFLGGGAELKPVDHHWIELRHRHAAHDGVILLHGKKIHHDFHESLREQRPIPARVFSKTIVKVLAKGLVLLDRRRVEYTIGTLAHTDGASVMMPLFLKLPINAVHVLQDEDFPQSDFLPLKNGAHSCRQMIRREMGFSKDHDKTSRRIFFD